jgi:hypothetical protein
MRKFYGHKILGRLYAVHSIEIDQSQVSKLKFVLHCTFNKKRFNFKPFGKYVHLKQNFKVSESSISC